MVSEKIWGNSIGAFVSYGKYGTTLVPLKVNADGELVVNLEAATVNIGDVDVASIAAGSNLIGKVGIDQVTANANEIVVKSITAGPLPDTSAADLAAIHAHLAAVETLLQTTGITILPLDSSIDSIDVDKMTKGAITTAHSAITATATSSEIDCRGYNSVLLEITISAAQHWTFGITGCMTSGGTFRSCYELANTGSFAQMITPEIDSSRIIVFHGIPDYIKIVATEVDDGATVTCKVQPFNS